MSERLEIRLSEEEKKRLAELAEQRGISMTDLVRTWIMRGDVLHVLSEQLQDITNDFAKWHVLENRNTSIRYLCDSLQHRMDAIEDASTRRILSEWMEFFGGSFQLISSRVSELKKELEKFVRQKEPKTKEKLIVFILEFLFIIKYYNDVFVEGFMRILQKMDEQTKKDFGQRYNDEFRTRYNEITSKYEDYLKRAQRELGEGLEQAMPRAKEFRAKE